METFDEISKMTDDELIARNDDIAKHTGIGVDFYYDELHRRRMNASSARMEELTVDIKRLTWAVVVLTVVSLAATVVSIVVAAS